MNNNNDRPSYYAILTAEVRYDTRLNATQKLLYAELTALSNTHGFAFPSNEYLASLYGVSELTISRNIAKLNELNYIDVEVKKTAKGSLRKIYINRHNKQEKTEENPLIKNDDTPHIKNDECFTINNTRDLIDKNIDKLIDKGEINVVLPPFENIHYLTLELINKKVLSMTDDYYDLEKYNQMFFELDNNYNFETVLLATRYVTDFYLKNKKTVDNKYAYFKTSVGHNVKSLSATPNRSLRNEIDKALESYKNSLTESRGN